MHSRTNPLAPTCVIAWFLLAAAPAVQADDDPPGRAALVDIVDGAAAVQPAGGADWTADLANRPLTTGDKLWVDADSRAELHLGAAAIRLGASSGIEFLDVADQVAQLRLSAGSMNVRLRYLSPDETFEVDTPNSAVTFVQPGEYRIDVSAAGDAVSVAVWQGQAEVAGESQSFTLLAQQAGEFHGSTLLGVEFGDVPPPDALDQWSVERDRSEDAALSANFLSRDMTGYEELDGNGNWQTDPDFGAVWYPQVAAGWAPYSQGYWAWVAPWGWTWIDAAPWGFAPFHYGRWVHRDRGWGWCPGQLSVRPVYAPALVVWGRGPGGQVAWFPLGYNEIYRPSRPVSSAYLQRVNVTNTYLNNTVTIDARTAAAPQRYANLAVPGALVALAPESFTSARRVQPAAQSLGAAQVVTTVTNGIAPTARSRAPPPRNGQAVVMPPRAVFLRGAVARTALPAAYHAAPDAHRVTVTSVPQAEALRRSYAPPASPAPAAHATEPVRPRAVAPLPGPVPPSRPAAGGNEEGSATGVPPARPDRAPVRPDRPPVMPRPSSDRVLTPPAAVDREREVRIERAPPPAPVERMQPPAPPPRKEPAPAEPAHRPPGGLPERNER
jgi:hypothetical protein